ncbi:helix-turn-helix transcriptional regulator [Phycicoccus avicenniae]|uniref:helix-turn-helix transcriptional regulator n=1 Tax=Phycicoccus avicenniae TaxID=2828860 RepID=UPI003D2C4736
MATSPALPELEALVAHHLRAGSPAVVIHRPGPDLDACLIRLEADTQRLLMNMQRHYPVSALRRTNALDERSRRRGVAERTIVDPRTAAQTPLLACIDPGVRVGPVSAPLMVSDGCRALLPIPRFVDADGGCCRTDDPQLVALALEAFTWVWDRSVPWQQVGVRPPLPPRRLEVAFGMVEGRTDREIADELGIGARTVSAEVRAIVDWLGARNRAHAVAMLVGAA